MDAKGNEIELRDNQVVVNNEVADTTFGSNYYGITKTILYKNHTYIQVQYDRGIGIEHDPDCPNIKHLENRTDGTK